MGSHLPRSGFVQQTNRVRARRAPDSQKPTAFARGSFVALGRTAVQLMHVSALTAADASRYRALLLHAYEVAADAFTSTLEERAAEPESWWVRRIADPTGLSIAFGAFDGSELIGTVTVEFSTKPKTKHKAHLIGMFVSESARGLRAGNALLGAALDGRKAAAGHSGCHAHSH